MLPFPQALLETEAAVELGTIADEVHAEVRVASKFVRGLDVMKDEDAASMLALLSRRSLVRKALSSSRRRKPSQDRSEGPLEPEARRILEARGGDGEAVRSDLLELVAKLLGIPAVDIVTDEERHQVGREIERVTLDRVRKRDKGFSGRTVDDLLAHLLQAPIEAAAQKFGKMKESQRHSFLDELAEALRLLPDETRRKVLKVAGIDDLTRASIESALAGGGLQVAMGALLRASGTGGYVALSRLVAAAGRVLGVSVPLLVSASAASALRFITGPWGFTLITAGSVVASVAWLVKKRKEELVPLLVAQISYLARDEVGTRAGRALESSEGI